jgi:proline iminopeptidase
MFSLFHGKTPPIRTSTGRSIASLEPIRLGGVTQWATMRGHDTENPILLYVHGGPGMSDMGAIRHLIPALEEHFVVVHWSQRGAGKSYSRGLPAASMTMAQFVADLEELAEHVLQRFGQQKLFLVGQSWGSALSMRFVKRRPELIHAYVGVNQIVDRDKEELLSYHACLDRARERRNRKAVAQLEAIGEPQGGLFATLEGTLVHKTWARNMNMLAHDPKFFTSFAKAVALNPELTLADVLTLFKPLRWNMELLWSEFCGVNFFREITAVEAPIYLIAGQHDTITSPKLEREYLGLLEAPRKGFFLFERSGHLACFEEPQRFLEVMLQVKRENGLPEGDVMRS